MEYWKSRLSLPLQILVVIIMCADVVVHGKGGGRGDPQVPCFFIFGDSLSDSGNNNGLRTLAKANFLPYGIDFPGGPTGRFTNGRTTVDLIGDHLNLKNYIPPFSSATDEDIKQGVNYASGSSGIRNDTGNQVGGRIPMDQQLENHGKTVSKLTEMLGNKDAATDHLRRCLYSVYVGSNDYMLNYFSLTSTISSKTTSEEFTNGLISEYTRQVKSLYDYGARKVVLFGLGPLGCLPMLNLSGKCSGTVNNALQIFNSKVKSQVDQFNSDLSDAKFIFVDTFNIVSPNLSALGLKVTDVPCCGVGDIFCLPFSVTCLDRNTYAFWDNAHPTEAANRVLANRAYSSQHPGDTHPMDVSHLVGHPSAAGTGGSRAPNKLTTGSQIAAYSITSVLICNSIINITDFVLFFLFLVGIYL